MHDDHEHHQGFARDLERLGRAFSRRRVLGVLAGASLVPIVGCGSDGSVLGDAGTGADAGPTPTDAGAGTDAGAATDRGTVTTCSPVPEETAGPYPGDATNGQNALALAGIVRSDIRASIGSATGTAAGVRLTISITLVNSSGSCAPLAGYAIYLWHCDQSGNYSMYTGGAQNENYLRGIQTTDANGQVTFTSIFPACYSGRWPHIHFEVYRSVAAATVGTNAVRTSQMAMPQSACNLVFATAGYSASVNNLAMVSLATDMVFMDGSSLQVPTVTGDVTTGMTSNLVVGVAA